jgi:hypothetical protein
VRIVEAALTDASGGRWPLTTERSWSLHAVAGLDPDPSMLPPERSFHRALPVLLDGGTALEGPPFEDVAIAIDEDENLLWMAVLRTGAESTAPGDAAAAPIVAVPHLLDGDEMAVTWTLGGDPPIDRVAYLYGALVPADAYGYGCDLFVQARIRDPRTGDLTEPPDLGLLGSGSAVTPDLTGHPHVLQPLAVPASGVRVVRRRVLARDTDGQPVVWDRTERRPLDVTVDVDQPWDVLERRPPPGGPDVPPPPV